MEHRRLKLTILGSSAALPANNRNPTSQILKCDNHHYLIDCGEGTQLQLRSVHAKMQKINVIFISHMHGDHYFGLPGLLNSMQLLGRKSAMTIVCPSKLKDILELQFKAGGGRLGYELNYVFTDGIGRSESKIVYEDVKVTVHAFGVKHRIPCVGYRFNEKQRPKNILKEAIQEFNIPVRVIPDIKNGADFELPDGRIIPNSELTEEEVPASSYAYCTDTLPMESTVEHVRGVSCLYHESTFAEVDVERAKKTTHSTARQAAEIAQKAGVQQLLLGHFSARYDDLNLLKQEAAEVFKNVELATEKASFII